MQYCINNNLMEINLQQESPMMSTKITNEYNKKPCVGNNKTMVE